MEESKVKVSPEDPQGPGPSVRKEDAPDGKADPEEAIDLDDLFRGYIFAEG